MGRRVYRSMRPDPDDHPALGHSARTLGARPGIDIPVTAWEVRPGTGGLSVSLDDPRNLPLHRRPPGHGGTGKDPVFMLDEDDLGGGLLLRIDPDNATHGFVEPSTEMSMSEYEAQVRATRTRGGAYSRLTGDRSCAAQSDLDSRRR